MLKRASLLVTVLLFAFTPLSRAQPEKGEPGKLSFALSQIASRAEAGARLDGRGLRYVQESTGTVTAVVVLAPGGSAAELRATVEAAGGSIEGVASNLVNVRVPAKSLREVARHPSILKLRTPFYASPKVESEGVDVMSARAFRESRGTDGAGVTVAVLDTQFARAQALIGRELPADTLATDFVQARLNQFEGVHGTACAEIVYDVAPGAQIILAGFAGDEVSWSEEIDRLVAAGVQIISHSIGFDNIFPPDGNNFFAQKVDQVSAAGVLFVTAAGNEAEKYFQGGWRDSNGNGILDFSSDTELLPIYAEPGGSRVVLRWDDPFGRSNHDYDLFVVTGAFLANPVFSRDNPAIVASSQDFQTGNGDPLEITEFETNEERLYVIVRHDASSPLSTSQRFYVYVTDGVADGFAAAAGTLSLPGDARGALTVGAVDFDSRSLESYSSQGPTTDGRVKPDVVAPDRVSTSSYGEQAFRGTSSATPHAAGAAALILAANRSLGVSGLRQALEQATESGGRNKNNQVGYGLIDLSRVR